MQCLTYSIPLTQHTPHISLNHNTPPQIALLDIMLLYSRGTVLLLLSLAAALFVPAVCHVASSSPHAPTDRSESDSDQKPLKNIQRTRNVFRASLQSSVGSMAKHGGNDTTPAACSFTRTGETAWLCDGRGMRIGIDVASGALLNVSANGVLGKRWWGRTAKSGRVGERKRVYTFISMDLVPVGAQRRIEMSVDSGKATVVPAHVR